jgi:TP901 family phage tail tape measure protein
MNENIKRMDTLIANLKLLSSEYRNNTASLKLNSAEQKKVSSTLSAAARANDIAAQAIRRHTGAMEAQNLANILTQGSMTLLTDKIFQASPTLGIFTNSLIYSTQGLRAFLNAALPVIAVAGSIIAVFGTIGASTKAAIAIENALINVAKTTNLASDELRAMTRTFQGVAKEIPISTQELLEMARVAGQLGITGRVNLERFSVAVAKLAIATDVVGEEGATSLARFLQASGIEAQNMGFEANRLGNVMNALENSTAATAREILNMTSYTAGLASQSRATTDEILAVNASLLALGVQQEAGGSAVVRILADLQSAVAEGGEKLRTFASYANMTAAEFEVLAQRSPVRALEALAKGMNAAADNGADLSNVMTELGINEVRERRTLSALAQGVDVYSSTLETARREMFLMNSLDQEVDKQRDKTMSKLKMLGARFLEIAQNIGEILLPVLHNLLDVLLFLADNIVAVTTAVAAMTAIFNAKALSTAITFLITGLSKFSVLVGALLSPLGLVGLAVGAVSFALINLSRDLKVATLSGEEFRNGLNDISQTLARISKADDLRLAVSGIEADLRESGLDSVADTFRDEARDVVNRILLDGELTSEELADAVAEVFELYSAALRGPAAAGAASVNKAFSDSVRLFGDQLTATIGEYLTSIGMSGLSQGAWEQAFNDYQARWDAALQQLIPIFTETPELLSVLLDEARRGNPLPDVLSEFIQDEELYDAIKIAFAPTQVRDDAFAVIQRSIASYSDLRRDFATWRDFRDQMMEDLRASVLANTAPMVPSDTGRSEFNAIVETLESSEAEIQNAVDTVTNTAGDRALDEVGEARERVETYTNSLKELQLLLSMPGLAPSVRADIQALQARLIMDITEYQALLEATGESIGLLDFLDIDKQLDRVRQAMAAYNQGIHELQASQARAAALGEELMTDVEYATAQQDLLNEVLQVFFEVDPLFREGGGKFSEYSTFFTARMNDYRNAERMIPNFVNQVRDTVEDANRELESAFGRLLSPDLADEVQLNRDKLANQLAAVEAIDAELLRLEDVKITEENRDYMAWYIGMIQQFRTKMMNVYIGMAQDLESSAVYVENAAAAAAEAGAKDFFSALRAVTEAGYDLTRDVLARLRDDFPQVAESVRLAEEALIGYYEALNNIRLRRDIGAISEYEALEESLRAAQQRMIAVGEQLGVNSDEFKAAEAQVAMFQRRVDAAFVPKTFEEYGEAADAISRKLRSGVITAEEALQQKISARQGLIETLSASELVSAEDLRVQLALLREDQAALNELVARGEFSSAARDYATALKEVSEAAAGGVIGRTEELNARIEIQNGLIEVAIARYGVYSSIVKFLQGQLAELTAEYDLLTGVVQDYDTALEESARTLQDIERFTRIGVMTEMEAAEARLAAAQSVFDAAKANTRLSDAQIQAAKAQLDAAQAAVDALQEQVEAADEAASKQEQYGKVYSDAARSMAFANQLVAGGFLTQAEAIDDSADALQSIVDAMVAAAGGMMDAGTEAAVLALLTRIRELREEAEALREADDLAEAARSAAEEFDKALELIQLKEDAGLLSAEEAALARIQLYRARAEALLEVAGEVTPEVLRLRDAANALEESMKETDSALKMLSDSLAGIASALGGLVGSFFEAASGVIEGIDQIITALKKLEKGGDEAIGAVATGVTLVATSLSSVVPSVDSFAANTMRALAGVVAGIAAVVAKIPAIGPAIAAVANLFISLLGDMSNGIKQIREEIEGIAASSQYLTLETIQSFTGLTVKMGDAFRKVTKSVSRGGLLGLLGFKKNEIDKEIMDFVMGIANGLANGFANAMTQAIQTGVAGGDWRQAFRDAFKTTILNTIIQTFVQAAITSTRFAEFIQALTIAIATGNVEEMNRLMNEELPAIIADGEEQVEGFISSVPDALKTYSRDIQGGFKSAFTDALKGAFAGQDDWRKKFRNAFKETILNALVDALVSGAVMATKFQDFITRLTEAIANGNLDAARNMIQNELPAILQEGEDQIDAIVGGGGIPGELAPEPDDPEVNSTLSSGLNSAFTEAVGDAFAGEPDWGKKLKEGIRQTLINSITNALVEAMMASGPIKQFMEEFTRILNEEGPEAAAKFAKDNFNAVVDAGMRGAEQAGEILADAFGKSSEELTEDFVDATMQANDFMTESLARTIAYLSTINDVIDEATSDMMISIAEKISSGFEDGFRRGIDAMLAGEEDWKENIGETVRDTILQSLIDAFIASSAIGAIAADFTEGFLRAMQDPQVDAAQWAKENIGTAIEGMSTLIETFVSAIPEELLPSSNPRSPRYRPPDRNEGGAGAGDRSPRQAGTNISEITGPTRDLLLDLLRPLSILPSWTSMIRDIRNDVRALVTGGVVMPDALPGLNAQPAIVSAGNVTNITIKNLTVHTQATNARQFYNELSEIAYRDRRGGK